MILKLCPRCQRPVAYESGCCARCKDAAARDQAAARAASARKYNAKRNKKLEAFYKTPGWREFSRGLLSKREYKCEGESCNALAVEVHHKIPIDTPEGWERRFDPTNCIIVCIKCHNIAHNRFGKRRNTAPRGYS